MVEDLTGNWKVIACQLHGMWLPESIFREFRYQLTADGAFVIQWAELSYPAFLGGFTKSKTGKVSVDPSTTPPQIDLTPDEGPFAGQVFYGIFELDYDICRGNFAFPGQPHPSAFTAQHGQVYEIWLRVG